MARENGHSSSPRPGASPAAGRIADDAQGVARELAAMREYAGHMAAALFDLAALRLRRVAAKAVLALIGGSALAFLLLALGIYLMRGLAGALAAAFDSVWLGQLVLGLGGLLVLTGGLAIWLAARSRGGRQRTVAKYQARKARQRRRLGEDVDVAAGAA